AIAGPVGENAWPDQKVTHRGEVHEWVGASGCRRSEQPHGPAHPARGPSPWRWSGGADRTPPVSMGVGAPGAHDHCPHIYDESSRSRRVNARSSAPTSSCTCADVIVMGGVTSP